MSRPSRPWYRSDRDAWYVYRNGRQIKLCSGKANKKEAYRRFLELEDVNVRETSTERCKTKDLLAAFLSHVESTLKPRTLRGYDRLISPFVRTISKMDANQVQPKHVTAYLDSQKKWGRTMRFNAITAIKRAWKWAHDEGHITLNQIASMKRPRPNRRTEIPDVGEIDLFLKTARPEFRMILNFVHQTGCRPGEASMIERRHINLENREVRFRIGEDKTSGKTGKPRVIHLNDAAIEILRRLMIGSPSGPLFRNSRGRPWTNFSMSHAARKIRERSGLDGRSVVYALRHQWATDALANGIPLSTVAEMMGNSPEIVARVYSHLSDKKSLLLQAANAVRPPHC
jgi:integrase/recombinase XerC